MKPFLITFIAIASLPLLTHAKQPNVLFIMIDDLNDWVSSMDTYPDARTPNIDRVADAGMLFTNAYCTTAQCGPSRTAMLTGLDANTTGLYWNEDYWRSRFPGLISMPEHFRKAGYNAYGAGKIFHGNTPEQIEKYHFPDSWDDYFIPKNSPSPRKKGQKSIKNIVPERPWVDWAPVDTEDENMRDHKIASWAAEKLKQNHDKPFFLAVGFHKPHAEWYAPRKYFDGRPLDSIVLPEYKSDDMDDIPAGAHDMKPNDAVDANIRKRGLLKSALQGYLACVDFVDVQVGRVLDALEESGQKNNTIVVLWSDHGYHLGEKEHWMKHRLWERATKTLLMFDAPGTTKPGTRFQKPVSALDIYPTLATLCELPPREHIFEGYDLSPALRSQDWCRPRPALTTQAIDNYAVRDESWRYIRYANGDEELYNHENDPNEWENLAMKPEFVSIKEKLGAFIPTPEEKAPRHQKAFIKVQDKFRAKALVK